MKTTRLFIACVATLVLSACGDSEKFKGTLSGAAEVPAATTNGSGTVTAELEDDKKLTVSGRFTGLTSNATMAHVHGPADKENNGDKFCDLTVSTAPQGTLSGTCTLSKELAQAVKDGKTYINIHTSTYPAGELRAQLEKE